jgi:hypothetical protein
MFLINFVRRISFDKPSSKSENKSSANIMFLFLFVKGSFIASLEMPRAEVQLSPSSF